MVTVKTTAGNLLEVAVDGNRVRLITWDSNNQNRLSVVYLTPDGAEVLESAIKVAGKAARSPKPRSAGRICIPPSRCANYCTLPLGHAGEHRAV